MARALRKKFKKDKTFPRRKFQCVYSEEKPMQNLGVNKACGTGGCLCPKAKLLSGERGTETAVYDAPGDQQLVEHEWCSTTYYTIKNCTQIRIQKQIVTFLSKSLAV